MPSANTTRLQYLVSSPRLNWYKRQLLQPNTDVRVFRQLATITTSMQAIVLRSLNQAAVNKKPWIEVAFWANLAELRYLENKIVYMLAATNHSSSGNTRIKGMTTCFELHFIFLCYKHTTT